MNAKFLAKVLISDCFVYYRFTQKTSNAEGSDLALTLIFIFINNVQSAFQNPIHFFVDDSTVNYLNKFLASSPGKTAIEP